MAVGDQELRSGEDVGDGCMDGRIGDRPGPMHGPVRVGDLAERVRVEPWREQAPGVAGMEDEDRREVEAGRAGEAEAILLRAGLGPFMRADEAGAVVGDGDPGEEAAPGPAATPGRVVVLFVGPDRRLAVLDEDAVGTPAPQQVGGVLVAVAAVVRGQVEGDDVVWRAVEEGGAAGRIDDVVGRRGHVADRDPGGVVMERSEGLHVCHSAPQVIDRLRPPVPSDRPGNICS